MVRHPGRAPKNNPRFVVANLTETPEAVYQIYCARGGMEDRLKELHQTLQAHAQGTACADGQVSTLRERLLKLAAWIERSARRVVPHLPQTYPWLRAWQQIVVAIGAAPA